MSEDDDKRPYAGPGRETSPREDLPDDHRDVKEYVEEVDDEVPAENLEQRVAEEFDDRTERPRTEGRDGQVP